MNQIPPKKSHALRFKKAEKQSLVFVVKKFVIFTRKHLRWSSLPF